MAEIICSVCGEPRRDRGRCRSCGTRLCSNGECRKVLETGRTNSRCMECNREGQRQYRQADPEGEQRRRRARWEQEREANRRWYDANREQERERVRLWSAAHPEKGIERNHRRRARKRGCLVSAIDLRAVIERAGGLCAQCRSYVPEGLRHIDHIIPLAKGGPHAQENLQLLCYLCNGSKGARTPDEVKPNTWVKRPLPDQPFLLNPGWR